MAVSLSQLCSFLIGQHFPHLSLRSFNPVARLNEAEGRLLLRGLGDEGVRARRVRHPHVALAGGEVRGGYTRKVEKKWLTRGSTKGSGAAGLSAPDAGLTK